MHPFLQTCTHEHLYLHTCTHTNIHTYNHIYIHTTIHTSVLKGGAETRSFHYIPLIQRIGLPIQLQYMCCRIIDCSLIYIQTDMQVGRQVGRQVGGFVLSNSKVFHRNIANKYVQVHRAIQILHHNLALVTAYRIKLFKDILFIL